MPYEPKEAPNPMTDPRMINAPAYRNFDDEPDPSATAEGPVFDLGGETFHCVPTPPADTFYLLQRAAVNAKGQPLNVTSPDVLHFLEEVICEEMLIDDPAQNGDGPTEEEIAAGAEPPARVQVWAKVDDLDRWHALLQRKRNPPHADKLLTVCLWLISEYTGRPTTPSRS